MSGKLTFTYWFTNQPLTFIGISRRGERVSHDLDHQPILDSFSLYPHKFVLYQNPPAHVHNHIIGRSLIPGRRYQVIRHRCILNRSCRKSRVCTEDGTQPHQHCTKRDDCKQHGMSVRRDLTLELFLTRGGGCKRDCDMHDSGGEATK